MDFSGASERKLPCTTLQAISELLGGSRFTEAYVINSLHCLTPVPSLMGVSVPRRIIGTRESEDYAIEQMYGSMILIMKQRAMSYTMNI